VVMAIPILLYHAIATDPPSPIAAFTVSPKNFAHHLELIVESGRTVLTVSQLVDALTGRARLPERVMVVTFDDGYADFAETAAPALLAQSLPSTLYVTTGMLRDRSRRRVPLPGPSRMLDWAQLSELEEQKVEIGAHSHTHPELDLNRAAAARDEIRRCKQLLEDELGHEVPSFAYPYGLSSGKIRRLVREAGYVSACSVKNALSSPADDLFALARLTVFADTTTEQLRRWLVGYGARVLTGGPDGPYTVGRRLYRQLRTSMSSCVHSYSVGTSSGDPGRPPLAEK
jgi:peptidoglycan/xylan/chitin deacetylase (PgdA/CDA1 family)